jgi:AAA domain/DnaB-like helicase N terminal domain
VERPLYSESAERAVLGSALLTNSLMRGPLADLCISDFWDSTHRAIYGVMLQCSEDDIPFDPSTIAQAFEGRGELDRVGGYECIGALVDGAVPDPALVKRHVQTMLSCSKLRGLLLLNESIPKWVDSGMSPEEIETILGKKVQFLQTGRDLHGHLLPATQRDQTRASQLTAVRADELLSLEIKPREMLLDPLLPEQGLAMLYGYRGTGKTYLALGIAVAVATGGSFLKWKAPLPRNVLYVDGELPAKTVQERVRVILGTHLAPENLRIVTPDLQDCPMPDLSTLDGQRRLDPLVEGVVLVVLDNLSALCRTGNENEGQDWLSIQGWMLGLRKRGISVLFLHHAGKNRSQRGTSKREDLLDTVIALKHPSDYDHSQGLRCEVHFEKTRALLGDGAKSFEVVMQCHPTSGADWTLRSLEDTNLRRATELFSAGASVRDVAEELGISRSAAGRLRQKRQDTPTSLSHCPTV